MLVKVFMKNFLFIDRMAIKLWNGKEGKKNFNMINCLFIQILKNTLHREEQGVGVSDEAHKPNKVSVSSTRIISLFPHFGRHVETRKTSSNT